MKRTLLISFLVLLVMIFIMRWQGQSLITPVSPKGIVNLEFAKTTERFNQLRLFWNPGDISVTIYLDFLFIAAYTWLFVTGFMFVKHKINLAAWNDRFISISVAVAFFDVCENFLMLLIIYGRFSPSALQIVFYCAAIKFILAGLVLLYLLITVPVALLYRKRSLLSK
jgi:hypothetical protein